MLSLKASHRLILTSLALAAFIGPSSCSAADQVGSVTVAAPAAEPYVEKKPTAEQLRKWNAPIPWYHPLKRLMRPVWKLQQRAVQLEEQMMTLEAPMAKLQPSVV